VHQYHLLKFKRSARETLDRLKNEPITRSQKKEKTPRFGKQAGYSEVEIATLQIAILGFGI